MSDSPFEGEHTIVKETKISADQDDGNQDTLLFIFGVFAVVAVGRVV